MSLVSIKSLHFVLHEAEAVRVGGRPARTELDGLDLAPPPEQRIPLALPHALEESLRLEGQSLPDFLRLVSRKPFPLFDLFEEDASAYLFHQSRLENALNAGTVDLFEVFLPLQPEQTHDFGNFGGSPPDVFAAESGVVELVEVSVHIVAGVVLDSCISRVSLNYQERGRGGTVRTLVVRVPFRVLVVV